VSRFPGIQNRHVGVGEIADIARNDREIVMKCGRGQQTIDGGESSTGTLGHSSEDSPAIRNLTVDRQYSPRETRPQFQFEPSLQPGSASARGKSGDAFTDLSHCEHA